jgi:hypothetical protein
MEEAITGINTKKKDDFTWVSAAPPHAMEEAVTGINTKKKDDLNCVSATLTLMLWKKRSPVKIQRKKTTSIVFLLL